MDFNRWSFNPDGSVTKQDFNLRTGHNDYYDDPVDRSQFRPDSEQVRAFQLTGSGSNSTPLYDNPDEMPSDLAVMLRSGRFDKAEVSKIMQNMTPELEENIKSLKEAYDVALASKTESAGSNQKDTV